jgi:Bacterial Ig domain
MTATCGSVNSLSSFPIVMLLVVASAAVATSAAAGGCTQGFPFSNSESQTAQGVTKKNTPCTFGYTMTNMVSVTPIARPSHGRLLKKSLGSFAYQPNANFVGQDSFTLQIIWNVNKSHTIRYEIQVVP